MLVVKGISRIKALAHVHNGLVFSEHTHEDVSLQRTGRLFGGLIADVKRKLPWYFSDFKDAIHVQSLASIIYIYLVFLIVIVNFTSRICSSIEKLKFRGRLSCHKV